MMQPMTNRSRHRNAGMTLLEVMIAAGLMAMAIVMCMASVVSISATSKVSEDETLAMAVASSVLDEMRGLSYSQLVAYTPPASSLLGSGAAISVLAYDGAGTGHSLPATALASPLPNPTEVQVTVVWRDKMGRYYTARASALLEH